MKAVAAAPQAIAVRLVLRGDVMYLNFWASQSPRRSRDGRPQSLFRRRTADDQTAYDDLEKKEKEKEEVVEYSMLINEHKGERNERNTLVTKM